eukprot:CAMPEP_0170468586 /NCGR_PEP_ID=MMETSP0123-20130129/11709_1 /TAXON_ID=182087 /ORGANISM="Favella ehrenbergii, Strain Fehren 1" /LENGTH=59 /DNA_ID=CAMNT_0010735189 /DNA_START=939 /DNA_END=1118 /DNA_ORIENTATION=+
MVWAILTIIFGFYETFKLNNSIIGQLYPTVPADVCNPSDDDIDVSDAAGREERAKNAMI